MDNKEFISRLQVIISDDLGIDGIEILYRSKEYFCAEYVSAHFNPFSYRIYINEDWLKYADAIEIIRVVAHEMRHAYQKIQIDFPDLVSNRHGKSEVEIWEKEFNQYINPFSNMEKYSQLDIEKDAIKYGQRFIYTILNVNGGAKM